MAELEERGFIDSGYTLSGGLYYARYGVRYRGEDYQVVVFLGPNDDYGWDIYRQGMEVPELSSEDWTEGDFQDGYQDALNALLAQEDASPRNHLSQLSK